MSSAATTTTPTGEPSWLPVEEQLEDLEAWLNHLPDELQAPPSPKPAKVVSRIEATGGLQSKATGSSKSKVMSGRYLRSRLQSLDAAVNYLQTIRRDLQESVTEAHKQEVLDKEVENRELRRRVLYLEAHRNDCCVVDCFPVPYDNCEQDGAHRLNTLGRVDSAWGASTLGRYDFGAHRPDTSCRPIWRTARDI